MIARNHIRSPCSPENGRTPVVGTALPTGDSSPMIGETALALTFLYFAVTLFLYYTLHYLHVL